MPRLKMERTQHSLITEGVMEHEQMLSITKPFWVFFVCNLCVATWLFGVLVAGMGLNFTDGIFVIVLGSIVGSLLPALTSTLGPSTRLSALEMSRFSLGAIGKRFPAFLSWINNTGWSVINNVLSATAFVALSATFGLSLPFWLALAVLVVIEATIDVYGHHLIQDTSKYTSAILGLFFVVIGLIAIHKTGATSAADPTLSLKVVLSAFVLLVTNNIGYVVGAADYTRYLPKNTPRKSIFLAVFGGLFFSFALLAFFGYITASAVTDQTPEGVMKALQTLTGHFAPLVLFFIAFSAIPANAINDNSATYCLMSAGIKLSRPVSAIFGAVCGYVICLLASDSFVDFFENFLFLFTHWITAWAAILLVHWFTVGKRSQVTPSGITAGCFVFLGVSVASIYLFSANTLYTGLLSDAVGGVDIGPYIGFASAATIYYGILKFGPGKYRAVKA